MTIEELRKYRKVLILGYGIEGKSTEGFFKAMFPEMEVAIADQKDGPDYLESQADYDLIVKSAGVNKKLVKGNYTTATNIFFANAKAPIVGITGTKGKSTTTTLIYEMAKAGGYDARLIGNIGKPMIDELLKPVGDKTLYIVELSSYQLDDIKYSPHISVMLNLFPEHMDYHGSFEAYKDAKKNIVRFASEKDYFVFNPDYSELVELSKNIKAKAVPMVSEFPFDESIIPLRGAHNVLNVRIAYTAAKLLDIEDGKIIEAVKNFKSLPHRLEPVGTFKGITFYDDAISTTPESTIQAINSIPNVKTIFLGGQDRGYDFTELAKIISNSGIENIVFFPDSGEKIKFKIENLKFKIKSFETRDMKEAVKWAYENTSEGSVVLLSCASPSYSVWKNFEEKGDLFKKFVRELGS